MVECASVRSPARRMRPLPRGRSDTKGRGLARRTKNDAGGGFFLLLLIIAAVVLLIKATLSALAFAYPVVAVCCWIHGAATRRLPPEIPDPSSYERPLLEADKKALLARRADWVTMAEDCYATGAGLGVHTTAASGDARFDARYREGRRLNDRLDECDREIASLENRLVAIRDQAWARFSDHRDYQSAFEAWRGRRAMADATAASLMVFLTATAVLVPWSLLVGRLWPADWSPPFFYERSLGETLIPVVWAELAACAAFAIALPRARERLGAWVNPERAEGWDRLLAGWRDPLG